MDAEYCIYGLIDPRDSKIFYIGKTSRSPKVRFDEHIEDCDGVSPKQQKIMDIFDSYKGVPDFVVLESSILGEKRAFTREVFWIEVFLSSGNRLTNASVDYGGVYFLSETHLEESLGPDIGKEVFSVSLDDNFLRPLNDTKENFDCIRGEIFLVDRCSSFTPLNKAVLKKDIDFDKVRSSNISSGKLANHGLPITKEEVDALVIMFIKEKDIEFLEEFFQRSKKSLLNMLSTRGVYVN